MGSSENHNLGLLFISLLMVSHVSVLSTADKMLMEKACQNGNDPVSCMQCLNSDPSSPKADANGLSRIIVKCLASNVDMLARNVSSLAAEYHYPQAVQALTSCGHGYTSDKQILRKADKILVSKDYPLSWLYINNALSFPLSCLENLVGAKVPVPTTLRHQTTLYADLSKTEMNIIKQMYIGNLTSLP